jgi:MFS family permease
MIETYAFLAAFTVQILVITVLVPAWFMRRVRAKAANSAEYLARLYPDVDVGLALERFLTRYRVLTTGIACLGLMLLGWLFSDAWRADWNGDKTGLLAFGYFIVAVGLPLLLIARSASRFRKEHKPAEGKRTAFLQRRGLFDFVSPSIIFVAVLTYLLFAAFMIYIERHPFPGFGGAFANIGILTLGYAFFAFMIYSLLYGKHRSPFETHMDHLQWIGLAVKAGVYVCIATTVNASITLALQLLDLKSWAPVAANVFFTTVVLLMTAGFAAPLRKREGDGFDSYPERENRRAQ